jgi:hypothetical protein
MHCNARQTIELSLLAVINYGKCFYDETGIIQGSEKARSEKTRECHANRSPQFEQRPFSSKTRIVGWPRQEMADYKFQPGSPRHGQMGIKDRFSLQQFSEVFKVRNSEGQPYILIGGQAVNYWAERYFQVEPELEDLQPFTSEDIDFKGGKEDVKRIANQLHLVPGYPSKVEMTALAGAIPFQIGDLKSNIEIVRTIPGISGSVDALAIEAELGGKTIRVLDPISLLACKLDLLITVSQEHRRDLEHVRILIPCVRAFLREFLEQVEQGKLPVKGWLGAGNRVLKLTTSARGRKTASRFKIDWSEILPLEEIARSKHEKIIRFREHQLRR